MSFQTLTIHTNAQSPRIHRLWTDWQPFPDPVNSMTINIVVTDVADCHIEAVAGVTEFFLSTELTLPLGGFTQQLNNITKALKLIEQPGIQIKVLSTAYLPGPTFISSTPINPQRPPSTDHLVAQINELADQVKYLLDRTSSVSLESKLLVERVTKLETTGSVVDQQVLDQFAEGIKKNSTELYNLQIKTSEALQEIASEAENARDDIVKKFKAVAKEAEDARTDITNRFQQQTDRLNEVLTKSQDFNRKSLIAAADATKNRSMNQWHLADLIVCGIFQTLAAYHKEPFFNAPFKRKADLYTLRHAFGLSFETACTWDPSSCIEEFMTTRGKSHLGVYKDGDYYYLWNGPPTPETPALYYPIDEQMARTPTRANDSPTISKPTLSTVVTANRLDKDLMKALLLHTHRHIRATHQGYSDTSQWTQKQMLLKPFGLDPIGDPQFNSTPGADVLAASLKTFVI